MSPVMRQRRISEGGNSGNKKYVEEDNGVARNFILCVLFRNLVGDEPWGQDLILGRGHNIIINNNQ
jgi:hypothetical protein